MRPWPPRRVRPQSIPMLGKKGREGRKDCQGHVSTESLLPSGCASVNMVVRTAWGLMATEWLS